jgi:hypothetical protein
VAQINVPHLSQLSHFAAASTLELVRELEIIIAGRMGRPACPYLNGHTPPAPLTVIDADGSTHEYAFN